ncbi:MAG TPA: cytochrome c biogenesis protein ResB [Microbacteriaceae bacterium]|nr:cytochrome c biogenesis protein ResB [Microbacteriaceae bacterium]
MSRPSDYIDSRPELPDGGAPARNVPLNAVGWARWAWTQLTSMRTALVLLLLLAIAAVPGSLVPQRSSDPNGVSQYFVNNPQLAPVLDWFGMFEVYSSVWFSAIYILLFISLIGCVVPRAKHHWEAMRSQPPATPMRLDRLPGFVTLESTATSDETMAAAERALRTARYRVQRFDRDAPSLSAERGYIRETGNLVFHLSLVGVLVAVAFGGGFGYTGQRTVVSGQSFVNTLASYDSFNPGRWFHDGQLDPFSVRLDDLAVTYETENSAALGQPIDYLASVTVTEPDGSEEPRAIRVNDPLRTNGADIYLLGNGYAPTLTVRDPAGNVVFTDSVPFLPQDAKLTSLGVIKIPDGLASQIGMVGFFYPTQAEGANKAYYSAFPDLEYPMVTLNVFSGDLGLDAGKPTSVYQLDTSTMTQLNGRKVGTESIELRPGETEDLPNGLGTVTFDDARGANATTSDYTGSVKRFASLQIHHDPSRTWVLVFSLTALAGLLTSLFVARRRLWVKILDDGRRIELAGLARGDDPRLESAIADISRQLPSSRPTEGTVG